MAETIVGKIGNFYENVMDNLGDTLSERMIKSGKSNYTIWDGYKAFFGESIDVSKKAIKEDMEKVDLAKIQQNSIADGMIYALPVGRVGAVTQKAGGEVLSAAAKTSFGQRIVQGVKSLSGKIKGLFSKKSVSVAPNLCNDTAKPLYGVANNALMEQVKGMNQADAFRTIKAAFEEAGLKMPEGAPSIHSLIREYQAGRAKQISDAFRAGTRNLESVGIPSNLTAEEALQYLADTGRISNRPIAELILVSNKMGSFTTREIITKAVTNIMSQKKGLRQRYENLLKYLSGSRSVCDHADGLFKNIFRSENVLDEIGEELFRLSEEEPILKNIIK